MNHKGRKQMQIEKLMDVIGADFFTGVPDSQLKPLCDYLMSIYGIDPKHHMIAANEGNCTALAAGYHLATGKVPVVYMQNSGEGNIINPVASLLNDRVYGIPVIFIIGWRGEPGIPDEPQHLYQGEVTLNLLKEMDIETFIIERGSVVIFNPGDNHACAQSDGGSFDYRGLNISKSVMADLAEEVTGKRELPGFVENVIRDDEVTCHLRPLHDMAINGVSDLGKEESLLFLISALIHITPYRYLETIRINEAKEMPGKGVQPAEAAVQAGFSDQSHFTNYFVSIIGLTPGVYRDIFFDRKGRREETGKMLTLAE